MWVARWLFLEKQLASIAGRKYKEYLKNTEVIILATTVWRQMKKHGIPASTCCKLLLYYD